MDRTVVSKSSFGVVDDHVTFYNNKAPLERLNYAGDIINSIFNSSPDHKVDRTVIVLRKHTEFIQP